LRLKRRKQSCSFIWRGVGLIFRTYAGASVFRFRLGFRSPVIRSFQFG
jgi:hypothetical protein